MERKRDLDNLGQFHPQLKDDRVFVTCDRIIRCCGLERTISGVEVVMLKSQKATRLMDGHHVVADCMRRVQLGT